MQGWGEVFLRLLRRRAMRRSTLAILALGCAPGTAQITLKPSHVWQDLVDGHIGAWVREGSLHVQGRNTPDFPRPTRVALGYAGTRVLARIDQGRARATYICVGDDETRQQSFILAVSHTRYVFQKPRLLWQSGKQRIQTVAFAGDPRTLLIVPSDQDAVLWWRLPETFDLKTRPVLASLPIPRRGLPLGTDFSHAPRMRVRASIMPNAGASEDFLSITSKNLRSPWLFLAVGKRGAPSLRLREPSLGWVNFDGRQKASPDRSPVLGPPGRRLQLRSVLTGAVLGEARCDAKGEATITHGALRVGDVYRVFDMQEGLASKHSRVVTHSLRCTSATPRYDIFIPPLARAMVAGETVRLRVPKYGNMDVPDGFAVFFGTKDHLRKLGEDRHRLDRRTSWCILHGDKLPAELRIPIPAGKEFWGRRIYLQGIFRFGKRWEPGLVHELAIQPPESAHGKIHPRMLQPRYLSAAELDNWVRPLHGILAETWMRTRKKQ